MSRPLLPPPSLSQTRANKLFREGLSVDVVAQKLGRALSTTWGYLEEYIIREKVTSIDQWLDQTQYKRIIETAKETGAERLGLIFDELGGAVNYGQIRIAIACWRNQAYVDSGRGEQPAKAR